MVTVYKIEKISSFGFLKHFISGRKFLGEAFVQKLPTISAWRPQFLHLTFILSKDFLFFSFCIYFLFFVQFSIFSSFAEFHGQWELAELSTRKTMILVADSCKEGVAGHTKTTNSTTIFFLQYERCVDALHFTWCPNSLDYEITIFYKASRPFLKYSLSENPVAIAWSIEYEQSWESTFPTMVLHQFVGFWINSRLAKPSS